MTVLGQVKDYVALYDDNNIQVYTIYKFQGKTYLDSGMDGGPTTHYKFKIIE